MPDKLGARQAPDPEMARRNAADLEARADIAALVAEALAALSELEAA